MDKNDYNALLDENRVMEERWQATEKLLKKQVEVLEEARIEIEEERKKRREVEREVEAEREKRLSDKEMWELEKQQILSCLAAERQKKTPPKVTIDPEMLKSVGTTASELKQILKTLNDKMEKEAQPELDMPAPNVHRPGMTTYASKVTNVAEPLTDQAQEKEEEEKRQMNEFQNKGFDMTEMKKYMGGKAHKRSSIVAKSVYVTGIADSPEPAALLEILHSGRGYDEVFLEISRIGTGQYGNIPKYQIWYMPEHENRVKHDIRGFKWQIEDDYDPRKPAAASADNEVAQANAISSYAKRMRYVLLAKGGCRPEVRNAIEADACEHKWSQLLFAPSRMTIGDGSIQRGRRGPHRNQIQRTTVTTTPPTVALPVTPESPTTSEEASLPSASQVSTEASPRESCTPTPESPRSPSPDVSQSPKTPSRVRDLSTRSAVSGRPQKQLKYHSSNKFDVLAGREEQMEPDVPVERYTILTDKRVAVESETADPDYSPPDGEEDDSGSSEEEEEEEENEEEDDERIAGDDEESGGTTHQMDMDVGEDTVKTLSN